jgi:nucleoid-associated protein YgaU
MLKELSGYYVYFEKNPQMRDFMLDKPKTESIDGDYEDTVTDTMRHVMEKKEEQKKNLQLLSYCGMVAAGIVLVFGVHMMLDSTERIRKMEETVTVLSEYVDKQQEEVEVLSQGVEQEEKSVQEISMEAQETPKPSAGVKTTASPDTKKGKRKKTSTKKETQKKTTSTSKEETASQTSALSHQQTQSYLVQKGDTLSQIVWRQYHDLSYEETVRKANGLANADEIYEGQCLILPKK